MKYQIAILSLIFAVICGCQKINISRIVKVKTLEIQSESSFIIVNSEIIDPGKTGTVEYGHCWATHSEPTINDYSKKSGTTDKSTVFSDTLYNLETAVKYYVRPYAWDGETFYYGEEKEFFINVAGLQIFADSVQFTGNHSSLIYGRYTGAGSLRIVSAGFEWTNDINFNTGIHIEEFPEDIASYNVELSQLTKKIPYYFRVYVNIAGGVTNYSNIFTFELPALEVQTLEAVLTGSDSLYFSGDVISLSVLPAENHGLCWSATTSQPTFNDDVQSLGQASQTGIYGFYKTGLANQRTYYYRAWAFEEGHFVYGEVKSIYLP